MLWSSQEWISLITRMGISSMITLCSINKGFKIMGISLTFCCPACVSLLFWDLPRTLPAAASSEMCVCWQRLEQKRVKENMRLSKKKANTDSALMAARGLLCYNTLWFTWAILFCFFMSISSSSFNTTQISAATSFLHTATYASSNSLLQERDIEQLHHHTGCII